MWPILRGYLVASLVLAGARAEVILDGSIGPGGPGLSLPAPYDVTAALGEQKGGNLFHSFSKFNIAAGESAVFGTAAGVENILARVTGGKSSIDGRLDAGANLFLMNPSGISFGSTATLNINGSFYATTADVIRLGSDGRFEANDRPAPLLTMSPPSAFGFTRAQPGRIEVNGDFNADGEIIPNLEVPAGRTLAFIGGDVAINGGRLSAPGGEVHVASVQRGALGLSSVGGQTRLSPRPGSRFGAVNVRDAAEIGAFVEGSETRRIVIRGGTLSLKGAQLTTRPQTPGDGIFLRASGSLLVAEGSFFEAQVAGDLRGRSAIDLHAAQATLHSSELQSSTLLTGTGGDVRLRISGRLEMTAANLATVGGSPTFAGDLDIDARSLRMLNAVISAENQLFEESPGNFISGQRSGNVRLAAADELILQDSNVSLDRAQPAGESVSVSAGEMLISGREAGLFMVNSSAEGEDGVLTVNVRDRLEMRDGALIQAGHFSEEALGRGAAVRINAGEVLISGEGTPPDVTTGITAFHFGATGGLGGDIRMNVLGELALREGGSIAADAAGGAAGGNIDIAAGAITITGRQGQRSSDPFRPFGISAQNRSTGPGGSVRLAVAGELELDASGEIIVDTRFSGVPGNLDVTADSIHVGTGSQISARTFSAGPGGNFRLDSRETVVSGTDARISALSDVAATGRGGIVQLAARDALFIEEGGAITASALGAGDGGDIFIDVGRAHILKDGMLAATSEGAGNGGSVFVNANRVIVSAGGIVTASSGGSGNGGGVFIETGRLDVSDGGSISVAAAQANAGDIDIRSTASVELDDGRITAQAAMNGGSIHIFARDLVFLKDSAITAAAGRNGGNVFVDPTFIVLDRSLISANAVLLTGGNIRLISQFFIASPESMVTATSEKGVDGEVQIDALNIDLIGSLVELPSSLLNAESLLRELCTVKIEDFSSFIIEGRGGVPPLLGDPLPSMEIFP